MNLTILTPGELATPLVWLTQTRALVGSSPLEEAQYFRPDEDGAADQADEQALM